MGGIGEEAPRLVREVEQDRAGLEERDLAAAGAVVVHDGRDLVVGADREELGLELMAAADVHPLCAVGEAAFLEHDVDLLAVRGGCGVEIDQIVVLLLERVLPRNLMTHTPVTGLATSMARRSRGPPHATSC